MVDLETFLYFSRYSFTATSSWDYRNTFDHAYMIRLFSPKFDLICIFERLGQATMKNNGNFQGESMLITGGTGSFGRALVKKLTEESELKRIIVFLAMS